MKLGVHVSIQGGMARMAKTALELGCETVQIFSRSPRGGKAKLLNSCDVRKMKRLFQKYDVGPLIVHAPYFTNLAAVDERKRNYSIEVLSKELLRAEVLGARFVIAHIGYKFPNESSNDELVIARVVDTLNRILNDYSGPVKLLLENTAGQGHEFGSDFETLGKIVHALPAKRIGTCFDTCHGFARGYDLTNPEKVDQVLHAYDQIIGLELLKVIHLNDSKNVLGSRIDRHEHIGKGSIGLKSFEAIINSSRLNPQIPGILETPKDSPTADEDNLRTVISLRDCSVTHFADD